jgi:peptidyl-prolyl cis-trans isomerase B (cyclophilin B)
MKKIALVFSWILFLCFNTLHAQKKQPQSPSAPSEPIIEIITPLGTMKARLYNQTPLHQQRFLQLIQDKFYDSLIFHRVIEQFMIQGGDPNSKFATEETQLGGGTLPGERIPAEFHPQLIHKRGALAMARDNNPEKSSSNCQFYIVQGKVFDSTLWANLAERKQRQGQQVMPYTAAQKEIYEKIGGTPHLDGEYTVFGEVFSGLEVIDKIAALPKTPQNRTTPDIRMKIRVIGSTSH